MLLVDFNQLILTNILAVSGELKDVSQEQTTHKIRLIVFSVLLSYDKTYKSDYGSLILCLDGYKYWRKEIFPFYKHKRKVNREKSDINWDFIFTSLNQILTEILEVCSWKILRHERAEADDIIATLVEYSRENPKVEGLMYGYEDILIVSGDRDFIQLHKFSNVKQFSPILKKQIKVNNREIEEYINEHIVKGDSGDGVPNILSEDNIFTIEGSRQKSITKNRLNDFLMNGVEACLNEEERLRYKRNENLVLLTNIPIDIKNDIKLMYSEYSKKPTKDLFGYLIKNRCGNILSKM